MIVYSEHLPVTRDIELEVADMRSVFRQDDVAGELSRREPEGEVGNIIQLELCMNPADVFRINGETSLLTIVKENPNIDSQPSWRSLPSLT